MLYELAIITLAAFAYTTIRTGKYLESAYPKFSEPSPEKIGFLEILSIPTVLLLRFITPTPSKPLAYRQYIDRMMIYNSLTAVDRLEDKGVMLEAKGGRLVSHENRADEDHRPGVKAAEDGDREG